MSSQGELSVGDNPLALDNRINSVRRGNFDHLLRAAWPENLDLLNLCGRGQSEVQSLIGAGSIAAATKNIRSLTDSSGRQEYFGSDGVTRTLGTTHELQSHPMIGVFRYVPEQCRCGVHIIEYHVYMPIVEQITERRSPSGHHYRQAAASGGGGSLRILVGHYTQEPGDVSFKTA